MAFKTARRHFVFRHGSGIVQVLPPVVVDKNMRIDHAVARIEERVGIGIHIGSAGLIAQGYADTFGTA